MFKACGSALNAFAFNDHFMFFLFLIIGRLYWKFIEKVKSNEQIDETVNFEKKKENLLIFFSSKNDVKYLIYFKNLF